MNNFDIYNRIVKIYPTAKCIDQITYIATNIADFSIYKTNHDDYMAVLGNKVVLCTKHFKRALKTLATILDNEEIILL